MTLIEVLVALAILLVMSAVVFEALSNSIEFHNLLSSRDETVRTARSAMSKLSRDLQLAYLTFNREAVNTYQTVFVGYDDAPSKLYFASLNHQRLYLNSRESDQTEITVWGEQAPRDRGHGYILYHREAPRIDQYPDEQGTVWPLAYNVRSFRLRFLDQATDDWKTTWDTRSAEVGYRLPRAVEIGLVLIAPDLDDPKGENTVDVPFLSRVVLEYAPRIPNLNDPMRLAGGGQGQNGQMPPGGGVGIGNLPSNLLLGGPGGMGRHGYSSGPVGGVLGTLPGAQPSKARAPRSPSGGGRGPAGGARGPGGPGAPGGPPRGGPRGGR